jgi:hypothetical protein
VNARRVRDHASTAIAETATAARTNTIVVITVPIVAYTERTCGQTSPRRAVGAARWIGATARST